MTNNQITAAVAQMVNFAIETKLDENEPVASEHLAWARSLTGPAEITHAVRLLARICAALADDVALRNDGFKPILAAEHGFRDLHNNLLPAQLILRTGPDSTRVV